MKFYVRLIVVIAVFIGALLWLQEQQQQSPTTAAPPAPAMPAAATAPASEHPSAYPPLQPAPAPQPAATAAPAAARQPQGPAVGAMASSPGCNQVRGIAPKARVTVVSCIEKDGWTVVTVSGPDRNNINDFLDVCQFNGMRDLASDQTYRQVQDAQGRPVHLGTFRMKF